MNSVMEWFYVKTVLLMINDIWSCIVDDLSLSKQTIWRRLGNKSREKADLLDERGRGGNWRMNQEGMASCLQWRRNEICFHLISIQFVLNATYWSGQQKYLLQKRHQLRRLVSAYWIFSFSLDDHILVRWPTTGRRQISRTVALFALAALARGRALLWVRSGLVFGQMHHDHDQLQQQNIKFIIKLVFSSPEVTISRPTRDNWCWRWLPREMHRSYVQVRLRNGTSDKTLWDT